MSDLDRLIVNGEPLTDGQRRRLATSMEEDEHLASSVGAWEAVLESVRAEMADVPSPETLILFALSGEALPGKTGSPDSLLSEDEERRLDAVLPDIRAAVKAHPSIGAVLGRMREDRAAFEDIWEKRADRRGFAGVFAPDRLPQRAGGRPIRRWGYRVAVSVAVAVFAAIAGSLFIREFRTETVHAAEAQTVTLADGSQVELAEGAELRFPRGFLNADTRRATLVAGEALFEIVHDPDQEFRVETRNAEITVLGTTFGVNASRAATEVTLVSGSVEVGLKTDPEKVVTLEPGEQSRVVAVAAPSAPQPVDVAAGLAWTGDVYAHDTTLSEVLRRLGERFEVTISAEGTLAGERITGVFRDEHGVEDALRKLSLALDARVERIEDGYRLVR